MVLRLKNRHAAYLIASLILTVLFAWPYLSRGFLALEHDTMFHLSRIEGLAESLSRGCFPPRIYPYKNNGFGYGSPMFYNDLLLVPSALLYLSGVSLAWCWKFNIIALTALSSYAMCCLIDRICKDPFTAVLLSSAFTFSNYRITDVYVRGALGEVAAMLFLITLTEAMIILFEEEDTAGWKLLFLSLCGLLCSHNLSALFGILVFSAVLICRFSKTSRPVLSAVFKAVVLSFLCTAWYTLPMLEQLGSQRLFLHYYASAGNLASSAMPLWKYFANTTVFGYGSNDLPRYMQMTLNPGYMMMFSPLLWFLVPHEIRQAHPVVRICLIIGLFALIVPLDLIPWDYLSFLSVIQFPWRLMILALILPAAAAGIGLSFLFQKKKILLVMVLLVVTGEGIWHVLPAASRTFGIGEHTTYEEMISGTIIDPYYSATYMRVELAGGEYLPASSPDFRNYEPSVRDRRGNVLSIPLEKDGITLTFSVPADMENSTLVLPLTWYKGYVCMDPQGNTIMAEASPESLVKVSCTSAGSYRVTYAGTPLQHISEWISAAGLVLSLLFLILPRRQQDQPENIFVY
ncbi:MAG: hypothetical protein IKE28_04080 [Solobacterium sp.]|nr:hypothetical protein [Solobacterium sp.]